MLPTVLQCLAMHTSSRGITDSAVSIVAALLEAAHDGIRAFGGAPKNCKVVSSSRGRSVRLCGERRVKPSPANQERPLKKRSGFLSLLTLNLT